MPRKQVPVQVSESHWSRGHMAAYIRPCTVQVRERSTESVPHHTNRINILSPFSYRSKSTNSQNLKNLHETLAQSRTISASIRTKSTQILRIHHWIQFIETNRSKMHTNLMEFQTVLRDSEWIFIIEPLHLQFEHEHATGGSALQVWSQDPNQRKRRRRRGKEVRKFWTSEEEERKLPIHFRNPATKSTKTESRFKSLWRFRLKSPIKTQVTLKLHLLRV